MIHARHDYNRIQDPAVENPALLGEGSTPIGEKEPVFLLRAQDKYAARTVAFYAGQLGAALDVDPDMAALALHWSSMMASWGQVSTTKSPDMPSQGAYSLEESGAKDRAIDVMRGWLETMDKMAPMPEDLINEMHRDFGQALASLPKP